MLLTLVPEILECEKSSHFLFFLCFSFFSANHFDPLSFYLSFTFFTIQLSLHLSNFFNCLKHFTHLSLPVQEVDDGREKTVTAPVVKEVLEFTEDPPLAMTHKEGNTLDVLMTLMLQYVHDTCHGVRRPRIPKQIGRDRLDSAPEGLPHDDESGCRAGIARASDVDEQRTVGCECGGERHDLEALKLLYTNLREAFAHLILCTQASSHVQFLVFYILALRPGLMTSFLEFLRMRKFEDPNCSRDTRRNAMAYIGSLLARGKFIPFSHVHSCLELICNWCHSYLENQVRTHTYFVLFSFACVIH